jgi:hypothetical protein
VAMGMNLVKSAVRHELGLLQNQLILTAKQMAWKAGFRTSKRDLNKFDIRIGKVRLARLLVKRATLANKILVIVMFEDEDGDTQRARRDFGLSHTKSLRPWFRNHLKTLQRLCVDRIMTD